MNPRLTKLAWSLGYFGKGDISPEDQARIDAELDKQGLPPRKPSKVPPPPPPSRLSLMKSHVLRHKGKYGLGAAALLGAALLARRSSSQDAQMPEPPTQPGF